MIPMNSELYTSFVISARTIAMMGGTRAQNDSCTVSALVTNFAAMTTPATTVSATMLIVFCRSLFLFSIIFLLLRPGGLFSKEPYKL